MGAGLAQFGEHQRQGHIALVQLLARCYNLTKSIITGQMDQIITSSACTRSAQA